MTNFSSSPVSNFVMPQPGAANIVTLTFVESDNGNPFGFLGKAGLPQNFVPQGIIVDTRNVTTSSDVLITIGGTTPFEITVQSGTYASYLVPAFANAVITVVGLATGDSCIIYCANFPLFPQQYGKPAVSYDLASPPPIGNTTPNTGAFTTLAAQSLSVSGNVQLQRLLAPLTLPNQNFIPNSSFLLGTLGWNLYADNSFQVYTGDSFSALYYYQPNYKLPNNPFFVTSQNIFDAAVTNSGNTINLSGWINNLSTGGDIVIAIDQFDNNGSSLGQICSSSVTVGSGWNFVSASGTVSASVAYVQVSIAITEGGSNLALITQLKLELGNIATAWEDSATTQAVSAGTLAVASNGAPYGSAFTFRNRLLNGDFILATLGTQFTPAQGDPLYDGWYAIVSGTALTVTQQLNNSPGLRYNLNCDAPANWQGTFGLFQNISGDRIVDYRFGGKINLSFIFYSSLGVNSGINVTWAIYSGNSNQPITGTPLATETVYLGTNFINWSFPIDLGNVDTAQIQISFSPADAILSSAETVTFGAFQLEQGHIKTPIEFLSPTLVGLEVGNPLSITQGGTGAATAAAALSALGGATAGANSDITSLTGLTTPLSITQGGTGAATAAAALSALGAASETAVKNVLPIGASASANPGTSLSLTTPSLTAPSNGYAIIDFMSNCSNSTYITGATVSATLGAVTEISNQGVYDQKYGKYCIAMNAGQSSTFSLDVATNVSVQIGAILNVTFIPTP